MTVIVDESLGAMTDPILGRSLDGRFTVREKLGEGGMGTVYRAHQHSVDREVAIKVVHPTLMSDPAAAKRFLREAKLTSRLDHPNAVGVLDFGQTSDGVLYLVMELVRGRTLDQVLRQEGVLPPGRVVNIGVQVCEALEVAHTLQIVHRDLKPANIMLLASKRDFVKVLDFGLAKSLDVDPVRELDVSAVPNAPIDQTSLLGTPAFLPPERHVGSGDGRSDLYSLGCVLYLLASGALPFQASTATALVTAHTHHRPTPLANVPPALAFVIDRLLAKDPAHRYQTAAETRAALEEAAVLDNIAMSSPSMEMVRASSRSMEVLAEIEPTTIDQPLVVPRRKLPRIAWLAALAILAAIVVIVAFATGGEPEATATPAPQADEIRVPMRAVSAPPTKPVELAAPVDPVAAPTAAPPRKPSRVRKSADRVAPAKVPSATPKLPF